jgi:hypothetical protein
MMIAMNLPSSDAWIGMLGGNREEMYRKAIEGLID